MRFVFIFILLFISITSSAFSQESVPVILDDVTVMRLFDTKDESAQALAEKASAVLERNFEAGVSAKTLNLKPAEDCTSIYWGQTLVVTVSKEQALKQKSEHEALAKVWLKNILAIVSEKPLKVSAKKLLIPFGDSDFVSVGGSGNIELKYNKAAIEISIEDDALIFTPLRTGTFKIRVRRGSSRAVITIDVKERAGEISKTIALEVTGNPASAEIVKAGILDRISDAVSLRPGAEVYLKDELKIGQSIPRGADMTVSVPLILEGDGYLTVEGSVTISINNGNVDWNDASELWVCNRPETVKEDGVLFRKTLTTGRHARMMYSHKNGSDFHRRLCISVKNKGRDTLRLLFRNASAGPDKYEMYAGHKAAFRYMSLYGAGGGYVLEIPPRADILICDAVITPQFLFSGICDLQILEGTELELRTESFPSAGRPMSLQEIHEPFDPFKIHPHGVFPTPFISINNTCRVSGENLSVDVGRWPWVIDSETGEPNTGNFGVVYALNTELINDTSYPADVDIYFTPLNGTSQGTFIIDGQMAESPVVRKDEPYLVKRIRLSANETRMLTIITIPEASSCYPVNFSFGKGI